MSERIVIVRPGLTAEKGLMSDQHQVETVRLSVVLRGLVEIELEPGEIDAIHALSFADGADMADWMEASFDNPTSSG